MFLDDGSSLFLGLDLTYTGACWGDGISIFSGTSGITNCSISFMSFFSILEPLSEAAEEPSSKKRPYTLSKPL